MEVTGYESAFVTTGPPPESQAKNSSDVVVRTEKPNNPTADKKYLNQSKQAVVSSMQSNVLNNYRSVTYNFTLSALEKLKVNNPDSYRDSETKFVILKSGGKGPANITSPGPSEKDVRRSKEEVYDRYDSAGKRSAENNIDIANKNVSVAEGFNKNSPGRFDMFIQNVEIDTLMAPTPASNATLPTQIKFEVIEPYSVNGFIEALYVSSVSSGYPNYISACYLLKMEFWGYPDSDIDFFKGPEKIPNSTRYFPIGITGIEVDITERGTRYRVSAVPYNERAFGQPSKVKKPIKMEGKKVGEILRNLMVNINEQVKNSDDKTKSNSSNAYDEYEIKFVNWSAEKGFYTEANGETPISTSNLTEIYKDNNLYKMIDPSASTKGSAYKADGQSQPTAQEQSRQPESVKYSPGSSVVQFAENVNIHDIIVSVIRDSEYTRNILKDVKNNIDQFGRVNYFLVKIEITNLDKINEVTKKPYQKYTYVVSPYKIHYTRIPLFGSEQVEEEKLKKLALREYNYIYTGQNVDVLDFKLNFNTLFYEAIPAEMANKDVPSSKTGAVPSNGPEIKTAGTPVERQTANPVPLTPLNTAPTPVQYTGGNAAQPLDDPYSVLARNMHEAVINSKASLITGELEILGDPLYIATNGVGNYNGKPKSEGTISSGDLDHLYSEVLIRINFRNPIDIQPLENGGTMFFDSNRVPFSGIYKVIKVSNTFKEGIFKQKLEVIRVPGQILDYNVKPTDPSAVIKNNPSPSDSTLPDTTRATPSFRPSENQLQRGFPDQGNNFTNTPGGLGGTDPFNLNRTYGLVSRNGALITNSSPIGQALPTDVASNIRLQSSKLASLSQNNLGSAALVAIATNVITGNIPTKRAIGVVAGAAVGSAISNLLKRSNIGSGIGEGATIKVDKNVIDINQATSQEIASGQTINSSKLPDLSINSFAGSLKELGNSAIDTISNVGKNVNTLVNDVGNKIDKLTSSLSDPEGIAAKVGLNTAALSGLSAFPSKALNQIKSLANSQPSNVNISQAVDSGLILQNIPASKIKNIPATQPYSVAPAPIVEQDYIQQVVASKGISGLENLYGVNDISKISSNLLPVDSIAQLSSKIPAVSFNPLSGSNNFINAIDSSVIKDKLATAQSQISNLTGSLNIKDNNILGSVASKFGSTSIGQSPLDKLVNKLNDPNASPYTGNDPVIRNRLGLPPIG